MSAADRAIAGAPPRLRTSLAPLAAILAAGLIIRLLFLPSTGFHNDVAAFESWTLTLHDAPPWQFYAKTSFADYPPGYFLVLWILGGIYGFLTSIHAISIVDPSYFALRILIKLPALLMDLVDTVLIFAIVRRYATATTALTAAAFFALNPASIYVSAFWGQVDSIAWGCALFALWSALRSNDVPEKTSARLAWSWIAIAFSILIKPQGALVAIVLLAFAFATSDPAMRRLRLVGTAIGIGAALVLAYAISALFHGTLNPVADFVWLFQRYLYGSAVYAYNTVNAFNLYAIKQPFWQTDLVPLTFFGFGFGSMVAWGVGLVLAAVALIAGRFLQLRDERAFLEAAMLVAFAFFALATRMHERYIYGAFLLVIPLVGFGRRYWIAAGLLSVTTLLNLIYSFAYQTVMEQHTAGVNPTDLWPVGSHLLAALNVGLFFVLGYLYLGGTVPALDATGETSVRGFRARAWFDPREGLARLTRLDWILTSVFVVASFVICIAWFQWPAEKIFDEIYYARAGEEYLGGKEIFEFTHPPLTKLLITLSMLLFGGLQHLGDTAVGWRFLNVIVGALTVGVLYAFAKRLTRSTLFAGCAAAMLVLDGFHYVQSRIATPEITVAFFSLCTLYAFYRVWTAGGAHRSRSVDRTRAGWIRFGAILAGGAVVAAVVATLLVTQGPNTKGFALRNIGWLAAFLYVETCFYLVARWVTSAGRRDATAATVAYADGSRFVLDAKGATELVLPEGDHIAAIGSKRAETVERADGEARRRYAVREAQLTYETPAGSAGFVAAGDIVADGHVERGASAWGWLIVLGLAGGALAASKWNGLFDFFVVWLCAAGVAAQRFVRRPALFGNPNGIPIDVVVGVMVVGGGLLYTLSYIPFFTLGHNFLDMVTLQREMYGYHAHLVATHPYASSWWQWPILEKPISYFYTEYEPYKITHVSNACCVAEILALPNPFVWWAGILTVPVIGVLAWLERNRGYALLVIAYFLQWLPWIGSPRIAFEYHFYPNLAIIILANAIVLQRIWGWRPPGIDPRVPQLGVGIYMAVVLGAFVFFFPILAGVHIPWDAWHARMWFPKWII
jgi:Gpi18-like mannosyltransferase